MLITLDKTEREITELQEKIASSKQNTSELQTFLTMKDMEKEMAVEEKFIESLTTSCTTTQVDISCKINKSLQQITASVQKFGEIYVSSDPQIMVALPTRNIDNLHYMITLQKRINTDSSNVQGRLLLSGGVVHKDGHLIYCAGKKGLQMVNLSDESITNVINNKLPYCAYVTTFGDKLFFTNPDNDNVTCCDYHGNILWTFYDTSVLKCPLFIFVDNSGNVFVVGCYTHSVVVISSDGQYYSELLSREDGLRFPQVLHYDQSTNQLLVANTADEAYVYHIKDVLR
ncbi:unnamed protein product [Mytilus coruscus]|uniref:TRIM2_3 n=1 Tax=Mytilus coruscus TaxID=42192 RepID=A0A6J8E2M3_MYTCO|nr:unnamed protein product [Mytilus coruscus]